jgi:hypothetical protein
LRPGLVGIVIIEVVALAWLRVSTLTRYSTRRDSVDATDVEAAAAPVPGSGGGPDPGVTTPTLVAIRRLGRMTAGTRNRLPDAGATLDAGARRVGSHAGRLQSAWRRATR